MVLRQQDNYQVTKLNFITWQFYSQAGAFSVGGAGSVSSNPFEVEVEDEVV